MASSTPPEAFFSISTIAVNPNKIQEVHDCFHEIVVQTLEKEPAAKIYRFFKVEGKNEFVWIEKFESRDAYTAHVESEHVQTWAKKYLSTDLFEGYFEFHPMSKDGPMVGGFDRP